MQILFGLKLYEKYNILQFTIFFLLLTQRPLEFRREISDLLLNLFKAKYDLIEMDLTKYIYTFNPEYKSRNYDENDFHLIIKHNQDYFRKSYFIMQISKTLEQPSSSHKKF